VTVHRIRADPTSLAADESVETTDRIEQEGTELARPAFQARGVVVANRGSSPVEGLAHRHAAHARSHPVVDRTAVVLAEHLPDEAAGPGKGGGLPEVVPVRTRGVEVHAAVERMHEHVGLEVVVIPLEPFAQVAAPTLEADHRGGVVGDVPVEEPGDRLQSQDFERCQGEVRLVATERLLGCRVARLLATPVEFGKVEKEGPGGAGGGFFGLLGGRHSRSHGECQQEE